MEVTTPSAMCEAVISCEVELEFLGYVNNHITPRLTLAHLAPLSPWIRLQQSMLKTASQK